MVTRFSFNLSLMAFIGGISAGSALPQWPGMAVLAACLGLAAVFLLLYIHTQRCHASLLWFSCLVTGFAWSLLYGHQLYQQRLPDALAGGDFLVEGLVINLPEQAERGERFDFDVTRVLRAPAGASVNDSLKKLRLNFYDTNTHVAWAFEPGQHWRLLLRLKPPRGFENPGGFDYEGWLLQQGYSATGYVRSSSDNQLLEQASDEGLNELTCQRWLKKQFDVWAFQTLQWINTAVAEPHRALYAATALGYKEDFTRHQWDVLKDTGTIHLVVVSGLHIVLMAAVGYGLMAWLARLCFFPLRLLPAPVWGSLGAMLFAGFYAGMTGFSLPTQRSLIMVLCALMTLLLRQQIPVFTGFLLALLVVMALDPLAGFSASLWLSFGVVAVLLYGFAARVGLHQRGDGLKAALYTQCVASFGLAPLLAWWMGSVPVIMPLANLLAVPWITFVVTPLVITSGLLCQLWPGGGTILLMLDDRAMEIFWWFLHSMQRLNLNFYWVESDLIAPLVVGLSLAGVLVLLAPRPVFGSARTQFLYGLLLLLPLFVPWHTRLPAKEFRMTVMDVGQGLSVMLETSHHVIVYDVGDKFSEQFDIGRDLVVQQVRRRGYHHIDTLIISHADSDHAGGLSGVLGAMPVQRLLSGNPAVISERVQHDAHLSAQVRSQPVQACTRGQHWQQDGVSFYILGPEANAINHDSNKRNNQSCVVKVSNNHFSVLLTGDIESDREQWLLEQDAAQLASDVLVIPHHGSKTSSSLAFLQAVHPAMAIASVGYKSQYGHPHAIIVDRYRQQGIAFWRTDRTGALIVNSLHPLAEPEPTRQSGSGYWRRW